MKKLNAPTIRRLSVESETHPATVVRFLAGKSVRALSRQRLERAALKLGLGLSELTGRGRANSSEFQGREDMLA